LTSKNNDIIIASKCFCGRNLYLDKTDLDTCGSKECKKLGKKFGSVSNWLVSNVDEIGKGIRDEIVLTRVESKIVKFLKSNCYTSKEEAVTQKKIASETNLAKSTISKTLISLEKKGIVIKNDFLTERGDYFKKGKNIALYFLDT
jgi:biotin operon repressor